MSVRTTVASWAVAAVLAAFACSLPVWGQAAVVPASPAPAAEPKADATPAERPVDRTKSGRDRAPILRIPTVQTPPVLDGDLGDACWKQAYHSAEFWNADTNRTPAQQSEVWVCADGQALYVAVRCHDSEPAKIHAEETKRNGSIWQDDLVAINIDPTYTQTGSFTFRVTARGTMAEDIPGGSDAKVEWRGDWKAGGHIGTDGWTAEAAIPWDILRYPGGSRRSGCR